jgi:hypothetical protein
MSSLVKDSRQNDNFKPVFKYYKSRQLPPDLSNVVDTHKGRLIKIFGPISKSEPLQICDLRPFFDSMYYLLQRTQPENWRYWHQLKNICNVMNMSMKNLDNSAYIL